MQQFPCLMWRETSLWWAYIMLSMVFQGPECYGCLFTPPPSRRCAGKAFTTLCKCERNVCMHSQVLAFRYTFLTSVQLLNSFTVPCVFIL